MQAKDLIVTGASRLLGKLKCLGDISTSGKVTATNGFEGNVVGNVSGSAGTAGAFTSAKSVTLTGDVTGSASSTGGWSVATTVKDDSHNHTADTIMVPKITKSYTGVIASANNHDNAALYCIKIVPDSYAGQWYLKYRVFANMDGISDANGHGYEESYVYINGMRNTYATYRTWNNILNTSYRPYYYHSIYRAKEAGATTYGHVMGINLYNSYNPTNTTYKRNITFEILDYGGCTISFFDAPTKYASIPGTGSTNYDGRTDFDGSTQGNTMSGDRNTTTTYGYVDYYFKPYAGQALYRYKFVLQGEDNRVYPIVTTNQTDGNQVAKAPTTVGLKPWKIWFYNSTTTINAGAAVGNQTMLPATYSTGAAYSFNTSIAAYNMVYLRGTYDKDKDLFYLYNDGSSPCTSYYTVVPDNTANITLSNYFVSGYYYLLLGATYSSANYINLFNVNPLYYFDGTNLKEVNRIAPDWDENDSTSPSYIENRTHYRTSVGYSYELTASNHYWYGGSISLTFGSVTKTYNFESSGNFTYINEYNHSDYSAFDDTVTSVVASISDDNAATNHTLTVYIDNNEGYMWFYDNAFAICLRMVNENGEYSYPLYTIYVNNNYASLSDDGPMVVTIDMNVPLTTEQFEYTKKLDSGYLNGKLITEGTGFCSEIFNNNSSKNIASGNFSHAEGWGVTASGEQSHAEGSSTIASSYACHAEGGSTTASNSGAHAEGHSTVASGYYSHAEGEKTLASDLGSHAEGVGSDYNIKLTGAANATKYTLPSNYSFYGYPEILVGTTITTYDTNNNPSICKVISVEFNSDTKIITSITFDRTLSATAINNKTYQLRVPTTALGAGSHAEGWSTKALAQSSHTEGQFTYVDYDYAHAEGYGTTARGEASHSEGYKTIAIGRYSHAEGDSTTASGDNSHAEGGSTVAGGNYCHAEGQSTRASSEASHAEGSSTVASSNYSHAEGSYTIASGSGAHVEGVSDNSTISVSLTGAANATTYTTNKTISYSPLLLVGNEIGDRYITSLTYDGKTITSITVNATLSSSAISNKTYYIDRIQNTSNGEGSHAEGYATKAFEKGSHSEGYYTYSGGIGSHAEGENTEASGEVAHAEGDGTIASGNYSHSEGRLTTASGNLSHAEGINTVASGSNSHVEGMYTTAQRRSQHVFGEYNVLDTTGSGAINKGSYIEIVGNGTSTSARSNARTLDWSGNEVLAGKLTVGAAPTANMDVATKQYVDGLNLNLSNGVIQLRQGTTVLSSVTLPVYTGGVS